MCEQLRACGGRRLVFIDDCYTDMRTGAQRAPATLDDGPWSRLIDTSRRLVEHVRARWDIEAVLHPHAESHIEHEDQIARFLEDTAEDAVGLCLDVGHHAYCDGDPVQFMRDHHARIPYLHLKSVDGTVRQRAEAEGLSFSQAVALDVFVEPSRGTIDYLELRDALRAVGYAGFGIVEQDMYPAPADKPLPIARRTREYLTQIGFG